MTCALRCLRCATPTAFPKTGSGLIWPGTVTCPADHTVSIRAGLRHRVARFGVLCQSCPLRADCTKSRRGRVISIHPQEAALQHAKARQADRGWQQDYRANRPVVERKISHFTRRPGVVEKPAAADTNAS
ncbi:transposase [Mycobacterium canetti]|uniref:transposase n=1 Tax=Mycobacterium canetti TaxID=78331 RepID=UPI001CD7C134|nr:transposase [Mycobacterium canetti]